MSGPEVVLLSSLMSMPVAHRNASTPRWTNSAATPGPAMTTVVASKTNGSPDKGCVRTGCGITDTAACAVLGSILPSETGDGQRGYQQGGEGVKGRSPEFHGRCPCFRLSGAGALPLS